MKRFLGFVLCLTWGLLQAQSTLSEEAEISLITCGPGQEELYSAFGHAAVRVRDPQQGLDLVFNYGIFDFDQPNFYLNFARGHLNYMLAVNRWSDFYRSYQREGRYIRAQVLNLDSSQKQAYWEFLRWNAQPENRDYRYDYFYDNCATRIRDGLRAALGKESLRFSDQPYYQPPKSIRDLCDIYLEQQPWGDLGIDLCLGLPMDRPAGAEVEMFLPDLQAEAFAKAEIKKGQDFEALVTKDSLILAAREQKAPAGLPPVFFTAALLVLVVLLTVFFYFRLNRLYWLDLLLFGLSGLLGLFLLALWLLTDHQAAAYNFNILLFNPLWLWVALDLLKLPYGKLSKFWLRIAPYYYTLLLASWLWLPQQLHLSLLPLAAIFILRSWHLYYRRDLLIKKPRQ